MSERPPTKAEDVFLEATSSGEGSDSADLTVSKGGITLRPNDQGTFDITRARHQLKESDQQIKEVDAQQEREDRARKNAQQLQQQNVLFWIVVGSVVGLLVISLLVSLLAENNDRVAWARSLVTLIAGGIVGGVAGYLTGKSRQ